jgi:hypothetical protein
MGEVRVTYYALIDADRTPENPGGIVRRTHTDPPIDESFRRDLTWKPTEYLERYRLGHDDTDHVEITEVQANAIIAEWRAKWPIEDVLDPDRRG